MRVCVCGKAWKSVLTVLAHIEMCYWSIYFYLMRRSNYLKFLKYVRTFLITLTPNITPSNIAMPVLNERMIASALLLAGAMGANISRVVAVIAFCSGLCIRTIGRRPHGKFCHYSRHQRSAHRSCYYFPKQLIISPMVNFLANLFLTDSNK